MISLTYMVVLVPCLILLSGLRFISFKPHPNLANVHVSLNIITKPFLAIYRPSCLYNEPDISDKHDIAGQVYSADEQCNMTYGNDAVLCRVSFTHFG